MTSFLPKLNIIVFFLLPFSYATLTNKGFTLELIYRDSEHSPLYPGNLTVTEKVKRMVEFSEAHSLALEASINNTHHHMKMHRHPVLEKIQSLYLVKLKIGHTDLNLMLDTGSKLSWTQVEPCYPCFPQDGAKFNISESHNFQYLSNNSRFCNMPINGKCMFRLMYGSGAKTMGVLGSDFFKVGIGSNHIRVIFGCANQTTPGIFFNNSKIGGILAMGKGPLSFHMQLSQYTVFPRRFSYCFGLLASSVEPSYLKFGYDVRLRPEESQIIPLIKTNSALYYVKLIDISVNGERLNLPPNTFIRKHDGTGGCIMDSGTPISRIIKPAYEVLKNKLIAYFQRFRGLKKIEGGFMDLDLCYERLNFTDVNNFPNIHLHFGGAVLDLKYFNSFASLNRWFCLGMLPSNSLTIIGSMMQIRNQIVYDIAGQRIYFKNIANCGQSQAREV